MRVKVRFVPRWSCGTVLTEENVSAQLNIAGTPITTVNDWCVDPCVVPYVNRVTSLWLSIVDTISRCDAGPNLVNAGIAGRRTRAVYIAAGSRAAGAATVI